jgi:hypothetical protein
VVPVHHLREQPLPAPVVPVHHLRTTTKEHPVDTTTVIWIVVIAVIAGLSLAAGGWFRRGRR